MARETAYLNAYGKLTDNRGYGKWEMLVVLKAYFLYQKECSVKAEESEVGWLPTDYDIAPSITKSASLNIQFVSLSRICPDFFEQKGGKMRISKQGISFFDNEKDLVEAAKGIEASVTNLRC